MVDRNDARWLGMAEARQSLERSQPRDAYEAVELRLVLELLPYSTSEFPELLGAEFGMQDKKGALIPGIPSEGGRIRFELGAVARRHIESDALTFLGPYIHGPAGGEFLYLNWRAPGMPSNRWIWRRKFPLSPITWDLACAANLAGHAFFADATGRKAHATIPIEWCSGPV